jgi:hypothetical protein
MDKLSKVNTQVQNENTVITHSDVNFNVVDNNNSIVVTTTVLGDTSQIISHNPIEVVTSERTQFASQWFEERRRQAKSSFNIAIVSAALSVFGGLACVASLYNGHIPEATATAIMSILSGGSSAHCFKLLDDANKRLDETAKELLDHE